MQISCILGSAYFLHISAYFNLHIMAYLPLCIFKLISAYLHLFCLPRPISLINIQTAAGAQRERCFCLLYSMYLPNHSSASENSVPLPGAAAGQRPQFVHFKPELRVLSLVQWRGALPRKDLRKEPSNLKRHCPFACSTVAWQQGSAFDIAICFWLGLLVM